MIMSREDHCNRILMVTLLFTALQTCINTDIDDHMLLVKKQLAASGNSGQNIWYRQPPNPPASVRKYISTLMTT